MADPPSDTIDLGGDEEEEFNFTAEGFEEMVGRIGQRMTEQIHERADKGKFRRKKCRN